MAPLLLFESNREGKIMENRNRIKELKRNTLIIAIANIGSKAIAFVLAPIYAYYLSVEDYGNVDLIVTTVGLLVPFFCLDIYESTFRFSNDDSVSDKQVISTSLLACIPGIILAMIAVISAFILCDPTIVKYTVYVVAFVFLDSLGNIFAQYMRGRKKMIGFAFSGILNSVILLISNAVFMVFLKMQMEGWLLSFLIARIIYVLYLFINNRIWNKLSFVAVSRQDVLRYLTFCLPLMPTTIMWWVMNVSDRYMLKFMAGAIATGIYSAANKIPAILSVFENVFYQSWQTTAISSLDDSKRDAFYSSVFNKYYGFLAVGVLGLLLVGKPLMEIFPAEYSGVWVCLAPLFIGVMIHALAGNLGSLYSVFKDTKGALYSTIVGASINVLLNLVMIPIMGPVGAAITTLIGYIVTFMYRWFDVRKFVNLVWDKKKTIVYCGALIVQTVLFYFNNPLSYALRSIVLVFVMYCERETLIRLIKRS